MCYPACTVGRNSRRGFESRLNRRRIRSAAENGLTVVWLVRAPRFIERWRPNVEKRCRNHRMRTCATSQNGLCDCLSVQRESNDIREQSGWKAAGRQMWKNPGDTNSPNPTKRSKSKVSPKLWQIDRRSHECMESLVERLVKGAQNGIARFRIAVVSHSLRLYYFCFWPRPNCRLALFAAA